MVRNKRNQDIADLDVSHPYGFDTRVNQHIHLTDGTIVNITDGKLYNGKTFVKTLSDEEMQAVKTTRGLEIV